MSLGNLINGIDSVELVQQRLALKAAIKHLVRYRDELEGLQQLLDVLADVMCDDFQKSRAIISEEDVQDWDTKYPSDKEVFEIGDLKVNFKVEDNSNAKSQGIPVSQLRVTIEREVGSTLPLDLCLPLGKKRAIVDTSVW